MGRIVLGKENETMKIKLFGFLLVFGKVFMRVLLVLYKFVFV